ncbi:MAG: thioredoxin family protein, partial [Candidatus Latescibacterota bacterium]|nr:thioredoxin family protein [Candidatus Latescibacterota bacterium]
MLEAAFLEEKFKAALPYDKYVLTGKPEHQESWTRIYNQAALTEPQKKLLAGFTRDMKILISSGTWCGDCVQQCPLLQRIAE